MVGLLRLRVWHGLGFVGENNAGLQPWEFSSGSVSLGVAQGWDNGAPLALEIAEAGLVELGMQFVKACLILVGAGEGA